MQVQLNNQNEPIEPLVSTELLLLLLLCYFKAVQYRTRVANASSKNIPMTNPPPPLDRSSYSSVALLPPYLLAKQKLLINK